MIQAKPTRYNNITFRSQLEARWAVFFDFLKIEYEYESDWGEFIYNFSIEQYKPDFYLPHLDLWVEVKPVEIELLRDFEIRKIDAWVTNLDCNLVILSGPPRLLKKKSDAHYSVCKVIDKYKDKISPVTGEIRFVECPKCGFIDLRNGGGIPYTCEETCYNYEEYDLFGNEIPEPDGCKSRNIILANREARNYTFND